MNKALKAIEQLKRPPLTAVSDRLRLLADELPDGVTGALVVLRPYGEIYQFGDAEVPHTAIGALFCAAVDLKELTK